MKYRLYTPGPSPVPPETLEVLQRPVHHHRTPRFRQVFDSVNRRLQYVYRTSRPVYTITGSGTSAFEAGFVSVMKPGSKVLNVTNGKFAERWADYARRFGCELTELKLDYGRHATPQQIGEQLQQTRFDAVVLVHSETSTATACDLQGIAQAVRAHGETLLIVDSITGIGALPFEFDAWGIDVGITGSQKSLMLPPGLGFVALSGRAEAKMADNPQPRFYLDLRAYQKSLADGDTPYTPANTLVEALDVSLGLIEQAGLERVWRRTRLNAQAFRSAMTALGLRIFSQSPSDSVTAVLYPAGVEDKPFRGALEKTHNVHVASGQGTMSGKLFRVNHMGYVDAYDTLAVVAAIEHVLARLGAKAELGAGVTAAQKVLQELFAI